MPMLDEEDVEEPDEVDDGYSSDDEPDVYEGERD